MAKKKPANAKDDRIVTTFRFDSEEERQMFRRAADQEGFTTLRAWMMYTLRKQAKQTLGPKPSGN
jgi:hypothetical protein